MRKAAMFFSSKCKVTLAVLTCLFIFPVAVFAENMVPSKEKLEALDKQALVSLCLDLYKRVVDLEAQVQQQTKALKELKEAGKEGGSPAKTPEEPVKPKLGGDPAKEAKVDVEKRPPLTYGSVKDIFLKIPKDKLPPVDGGFWNDLQIKIATDWLDENVVGAKLAMTLKFGSPLPVRNGVVADLWGEPFRAGHIVVKRLSVSARFPLSQVDALSKKINGRSYPVEGTIEKIIIRSPGSKDSSERGIVTDVTIMLKDSTIH